MAALAESPVIVGEKPPAPPPPPTSEIHVTPGATDNGPAQPPPKPGSARERMLANLQKKAKVSSLDSRTVQAETPAAVTPSAAPSEGAPPPIPGAPSSQPKPEDKTAEPDKAKKNPWKLVDEWKQKYGTLEAEYAKAKQSSLAEQERTEFKTKIDAVQKRADELENEIRFVNYEKSAEYQSKYEEPYKKSWARAAKELSEIPLKTAEGERPATIQDLAEIVNLPLGRARAVADEAFGPFADDIMGYRKEILGLLEAKNAALEDAKKNSIQRDKEREGQQQKLNGEIATHIKDTWEKANQEFVSHEKYGPLFRPVEGDQEGNTRLAKGFELVDRAFSENPNNPNLTPEDRAKIVRRHAAVRNRAASWGRLHANYDKLLSEHAALKKELEQYKASSPSTGGRSPAPAAPTHTSARDGVMSRLRSLAKPG